MHPTQAQALEALRAALVDYSNRVSVEYIERRFLAALSSPSSAVMDEKVASVCSMECDHCIRDDRCHASAPAPSAAEPVAPNLPLVITSAPDHIWLDLGFDPKWEGNVHFSNLNEVTWSEDNATGHGIEYLRADLPAPSAAEDAKDAPDALMNGLAKAVEELKEDGFWRSCSGCHELNEGHDTGPRSAALGCVLGGGCSECGGIGAIWDTTDYAAMAKGGGE